VRTLIKQGLIKDPDSFAPSGPGTLIDWQYSQFLFSKEGGAVRFEALRSYLTQILSLLQLCRAEMVNFRPELANKLFADLLLRVLKQFEDFSPSLKPTSAAHYK